LRPTGSRVTRVIDLSDPLAALLSTVISVSTIMIYQNKANITSIVEYELNGSSILVILVTYASIRFLEHSTAQH